MLRTSLEIPFTAICCVWDHLDDARTRFRLATLFRIERLQAIALESVPVASLDKCSATGKIELMSFRLKHKDIKHNVPRTWSLKQDDLEYNQIIHRSGNLEWTDNSLRWATRYARLDVLNWWLHSGLEMAIPYDVIEAGAQSNSLDMLRWWKKQDDQGRFKAFNPSQRKSIWNMDTVLYFGSLKGNVGMLDWVLSESGNSLPHTSTPLDGASTNGHIHVLDWWKLQITTRNWPIDSRQNHIFQFRHVFEESDTEPMNQTISVEYGTGGMDCASKNGHIDVLNWWKNSGFKLKWSNMAMTDASANGHVDVLDWWKNSGLEPLEWNENAVMDRASAIGHVQVLQWWKHSGWKYNWTKVSMNAASENGHVAVLEWWKQSGLPLRYSNVAMTAASKKGHIDVLQWWRDSGIELLYGGVMDQASMHNQVAALEWWKASGLKITWSNQALDYACEKGYVAVLEWWKASGLALKWTASAMDQASANGHVEVLQWWKESGLECKYSAKAIDAALKKGHLKILEWWKASGLEMLFTPLSSQALKSCSTKIKTWWLNHALVLD